MATKTSQQPAIDLSRIKAELQSDAYQKRVAEAMRDVKSLQEKAIIDRSRLNMTVSL